MGGMAVRVRPSLFTLGQGCLFGQSFAGHKTFQRHQPMLVVMRSVVGLAAIGGGFQFGRQRIGPFFPGEMTLF